MPSLQQLQEFKDSFANIGNEAAFLAEKNLAPNELPLPDAEPTGTIAPDTPPPPPPAEDSPNSDAPPSLGAAPSGGGSGLLDFGALLGDGEASAPIPDESDLPDPFAGLESQPPGEEGEEEGENDELTGLLGGLADDIEAGRDDEAAESGDDTGLPEAGDLDLGDFGDFSAEGLEDSGQAEGETTEGSDDTGLPEEGSLDLGDLGDLGDFSTESLEDSGQTEGETTESSDDTGLPEEGGLDLGDLGDLGDFSTESLEDSGQAGSETAESGDAALPEEGEINLDLSSLEDGSLEPGPGTGDDQGSPAAPDLADFSLPGLDDILASSPVPSGTAETASVAESQLLADLGVSGADEVEEIQLNNEDLAKFQKTLDSYPLNLRIACEEIIAEQAVAPDLMSSLVKALIRGAPARETAALAGKILGRTIAIPRGFEKKTGAALEAEQNSFAYIFVHKFFPLFRLFLFFGAALVILAYLGYRLIYTPIHANSIYRDGYNLIGSGDYAQANERFSEAFRLHRIKNWFYRYAEAFRDERRYLYAEEKYDELLRYYPRDKKGVLDYAALETYYQYNYQKADDLLRRNILDYSVDDKDALLALGDTNLAWGEIEPERYEEARRAYARLLEMGWTDPVVERMMKYFIRTDNLKEVLPLQNYFMSNPKRKISASALAELGGYLLDKRLEEPKGVPNAYVERIDGLRDLLIKAVQADPSLPEGHYHLARYYNRFGNTTEERQTLERAVRAFDAAPELSIRRLGYRIDAQRRYAQVLINARGFISGEEELVKGINLYEDALNRDVMDRRPEFGRLYADLGDLEYFTKLGNMEQTLRYYLRSEQHGWAPPEIQYRMGSAYYHLQQWSPALDRFFTASSEISLNRRLLHALGNVSYQRGNYFAAQGYYNRLLDLLEAERARFPQLRPNDRPEHMELAERIMIARNNLGVTMEALAEYTGNTSYRSQALGLYAESARAWDGITRNPDTMVRSPGINLGYLNSRNSLYPEPGYQPQIFIQIDKDMLEPSVWEELAPPGYRLSDDIPLN